MGLFFKGGGLSERHDQSIQEVWRNNL